MALVNEGYLNFTDIKKKNLQNSLSLKPAKNGYGPLKIQVSDLGPPFSFVLIVRKG